ncbi:MAG: hypothetical protein AAGH82_01085 [Pseudomonadota bacterium]
MPLGTGSLEGRNSYVVRRTFSLTGDSAEQVQFETSDDFVFERGTPEPGFALFSGDPSGLAGDQIEPTAEDTRFLIIANEIKPVMGRQAATLPDTIDIDVYDHVILWCFTAPVLLGIGKIES